MVFPSLFEGFGIPLIEAMACGCPVVCSDRTAIPEILGNAGVIFNPEFPEDIADKIWSVWISNHMIKELRVKGLERSRQFSWENTAKKTLAVYQKIFVSKDRNKIES
jgi:glycosyltransferase involved in cell wall biosynthesis